MKMIRIVLSFVIIVNILLLVGCHKIGIGPDKNLLMADQYRSQAEELQKAEEYQEAAELYRKTVEAEQASAHPRPEQLAETFYQGGSCYREIEQYEDALSFFGQAVALYRQLERKPEMAKSLRQIGKVYSSQDNHDKAREYYEQALEIDRQEGDQAGIATDLYNIAKIYQNLGNYAAALDYYHQTLELDRQIGNQTDIAIDLTKIGNVYETLGKYDEALDYYEQALDLDRQVGDKTDIAIDLSNIGDVYEAWGKYDQAIESYTQALQLNEELERQSGIAVNLSNIGRVYDAWGKYDKAIELYEQALELNRQLERQQGIAINLTNIGWVSYKLSQYDKALNYYEQALELNRQLGRQTGIIENLINMGNVDLERDQYDTAVDYYEQALELARQMGEKSNIAEALNDIGKVYFKSGDYEKALATYEQALELARQMGEKPSIAEFLTNIGKVYKAQGDYANAIPYLADAVAIKEELRKTATGDVRRDYLASQIETYQLLTSCYVLSGDFANALRTIELTRAKLLLEQLVGAGVEEVEPPSLDHIQDHLPADTAVLIYADIGTDAIVQVAITKKQITALEWLKTDFTQPVMKQNRSKIAFVLEDEDQPQDDDFARIIRYYRELLIQAWPIESISHSFYRLLISEFQEQLTDITKLIIVPDGMLNFLPFETLINEDGEYLVEFYQITYAQSLGVLDRLRQRDYSQISRKPLLAFGGAVYQEPVEPYEGIENEAQLKYVRRQVDEAISRGAPLRKIYASSLGIAWSDLPGSFDEVTTIKQIVDGVEIVTGDQVNETTIKTQSADGTLAQYEILHFATHGTVELLIPELSALVLSQFAEPGEKEDDYLRVGEVAQLKLQADFVNLSACETGLGRVYGGQGVVGLSQSFLLAGANGLSVSLWAVEDEATAQFMIALYKLIAEGMSYPDAITEVKRRFIAGEFGKEWQSPYYWSPFVYYGKG